jgi:hypothetical protein
MARIRSLPAASGNDSGVRTKAGDRGCGLCPWAIVADVARRADVCAEQIYQWRQEIRSTGGGFCEVVVAAIDYDRNDRATLRPSPAIEL